MYTFTIYKHVYFYHFFCLWCSLYVPTTSLLVNLWVNGNNYICTCKNVYFYNLKRWCIFLQCIFLRFRVSVMVFNATFNNISVISWRSVLLVEENGVRWENHRPAASHWQILSHNVVSSTPGLSGIWTQNFSRGRHWLHR
jgi:hypothetical protein